VSFQNSLYPAAEEVYQSNLKDLVELAEIGDILKVPQRKLSVGQRKRCELVAALLHDPQVIFLDEPTNALDIINAKRIREFIKGKGREGKCSIILTSHNVSDIEQVCERVIIINIGKIVFDGSIRELGRLDGIKKEIRIEFSGPWTIDEVKKMGTIKESNGQEILLEVESEKATMVASHLFSNFPVKDISITDPPLEKVIESIYLKKT
jgi:ABC-2 type transport system ATP-binding protein